MPLEKEQVTLNKNGVLGIDYHHQRRRRRAHSYRLWRRGVELARTIRTYCPGARQLLDIGTADGLTIPVVKKELPSLQVIGLDLSLDLLRAGDLTSFSPVLADAVQLPFPSGRFDVVSATAVIEHVPRPTDMLQSCHRVLRRGGICVVTTPDPFFERLAVRIGHLPDDQHERLFNLTDLESLFQECGFEIVELGKFMLSPVGFPRERLVECALKRIGGERLLLNQIACARRL